MQNFGEAFIILVLRLAFSVSSYRLHEIHPNPISPNLNPNNLQLKQRNLPIHQKGALNQLAAVVKGVLSDCARLRLVIELAADD